MVIGILIGVIAAALLIIILMTVSRLKKKEGEPGSDKERKDRLQRKGKSAIIKEAEKKLMHDPHNVNALESLGDVYYTDKNWEKTWQIYKTLYDISTVHVEIDVAKAALRMGVAAYNMEKLEDATTSLITSLKKNPDSFECNYFLGQTFLKTNVMDKAIYCFKKARALEPENSEIYILLGGALYKAQKYKDSLPFLKRALDEHPDNKELLFQMAVAMTEVGMGDKALKVFMHLRPDPQFGAQACLEAGKMHERVKKFADAIKDYEIALKLPSVEEQLMLQIKYRLGNAYIAMNNIAQGLTFLKQIQMSKTGYKDVDILVARYSELNQNKNLQIYLMSGTSDFVALCRNFISIYHKDAFVKVEDVQVASECVEIVCNVENPRWEAKQLFRFYRTQNVIGDINIREFHSKVRDTKCDAGYCVTMGSFTESAHKYIDGRPIDLIEKDQLTKILKRITNR